jgi:hypothetical protein
MMIALFLGWLATIALLASCVSITPAPVTEIPPPATATVTAAITPTLTPTPAPEVVQVHINPAITYQILDGFGADCYTFPYANDIDWNWNAVKFVFDELDLAYIRLAPWLGWWETVNDNDDPYSINWSGFGTVHDIINNHDVPFGQYLARRGIELSVGVWDFGGVGEYCETCGDWLASGQPRTIPPEMYPEMGESIAAYILNMQENGVPIPVAEVQNEPDIQAAIQYTPETLVAAGKVLAEMLDYYGLQDVMLHGPNLHSPIGNVRWIEAWLADESLRQRTVAVSYHTWWSENQTFYEEIWKAAQKYDKPVWATEAGYSGNATHIDPQDWQTVFGYAESYYRAIAWSHASRVYHWALLGNDAAVGKQGEKYPMFYALKHFTNYIPKGSVLVESQSDDSRLRTLAFRLPDGGYSVIVLNANQKERVIELSGIEAEIEKAINTSEENYEVKLQSDENGALVLPPRSITSMRFK